MRIVYSRPVELLRDFSTRKTTALILSTGVFLGLIGDSRAAGVLSIVSPSNGGIQLTVKGSPGAVYAVQSTTNLIAGNWTNSFTAQADPSGLLVATNLPRTLSSAFYRAMTVPRPTATTPAPSITENVPKLFQLTAKGATNNSPGGGLVFEVISPTVLGALYQVAADNVTPTTPITANAVIVNNAAGWLYYAPQQNFYGNTDSLVYNVADPYGQTSDGASLTMNVVHVDQPPFANFKNLLGYNDSIENIFTLDYGDPDNLLSELTIHFTSLPTKGKVYLESTYPNGLVTTRQSYSNQNSFVYVSSTPFAYGSNYDSLTFYISDPSGSNSLVATNYISLRYRNLPPVSTTPTNYYLLENSNTLVTFTGTDPDTNVLYFYISRLPANGALIFQGMYNLSNYPLPILLTVNPGVDPVLEFVPNTNFAGTDSLGYTISDQSSYAPGGLDVPIPGTVYLNVGVPEPSPVISGQTNGVIVHIDSSRNVTSDGVIDSLVVTDAASEATGAKIFLLIEALDQNTNTSVYVTSAATTNVTVTNLNNFTLKVEGTQEDINSFIAANHIYYHPSVTIGKVHLEAIANDEGNTPYGPVGSPQQTTNLISVLFVNP